MKTKFQQSDAKFLTENATLINTLPLPKNKSLTKSQLLEKRASLTLKKRDIQEELSELGLTSNRRKYATHTIALSDIKERDRLVKEIGEIDRELIDINVYVDLYKQEESYFKEIILESLGKEAYDRIVSECRVRGTGGEPRRVNLQSDKVDQLKSEVKNLKSAMSAYHEVLRLARIELTQYIGRNLPSNGKEIFMKDISPLNRIIPSITDLDKEKRKLEL